VIDEVGLNILARQHGDDEKQHRHGDEREWVGRGSPVYLRYLLAPSGIGSCFSVGMAKKEMDRAFWTQLSVHDIDRCPSHAVT
jgi:hypothetical protein